MNTKNDRGLTLECWLAQAKEGNATMKARFAWMSGQAPVDYRYDQDKRKRLGNIRGGKKK